MWMPLHVSGGKSSPEKVSSSLPGLSQETNCPQRAIQTLLWGWRGVDHCPLPWGWAPCGIGKGIWKGRAGSTQHFCYLICYITFWLLVKRGLHRYAQMVTLPMTGSCNPVSIWEVPHKICTRTPQRACIPGNAWTSLSITHHRGGPWWMWHQGGAGQTQSSWGSLLPLSDPRTTQPAAGNGRITYTLYQPDPHHKEFYPQRGKAEFLLCP